MKEKLGNIAILINGDRGKNYPAQSEITNQGEIPFVNAGHLTGREIDFDNMNYISCKKYNKLNSGKFIAGDILYCLRGSLGKKALVPKGVYGAIASSLVIIRPDDNRIRGDYLLFALESPDIKAQLVRANNGSSQPNLSAASVRGYNIDIPSIREQDNIVTTLKSMVELISIQKRQIDAYDTLIKSRFVEMFGDYFRNNSNEEELRELCDFIDYRGKTPEKADSGVPLITAKNVKDNKFFVEPQEFIPEKNYDDVMTRGIPRVNDVLFTTEAPLGNVCRIPDVYEKFCIGQRLIVMQPREMQLTSEYLEYALVSSEFQNKVWQKSSGSTVKGIRSKLLVRLTIPVPPLELQNQFSSFVHQIDKLKLL